MIMIIIIIIIITITIIIIIVIKEIFAPFQFRTRVYPLRVRRFVHWAAAVRHIDFMLCSVFMSSW